MPGMYLNLTLVVKRKSYNSAAKEHYVATDFWVFVFHCFLSHPPKKEKIRGWFWSDI